MNRRIRAQLTVESAQAMKRRLEREAAQTIYEKAPGTALDLNTQQHWANVGRWRALREILCGQDWDEA